MHPLRLMTRSFNFRWRGSLPVTNRSSVYVLNNVYKNGTGVCTFWSQRGRGKKGRKMVKEDTQSAAKRIEREFAGPNRKDEDVQ